jgi:probable rRNA maturation factor
LARFARDINRRVLGSRGFCCLIADDAELCRLNRDFRRKDAATDVLSFPSSDPQGSLGDLAISLDRAASQAAEHGHGVGDEIRILMLHGALHLAGMDHDRDRGQMARAETRWRKAFGLPSGLIERVLR